MLISIFKSNQRITNVFTIVITSILWICAFYGKEGFIINKWIDGFLAISLIVVQSIWINRIVNQNKLIERSSYITSLIFVVLYGVVFFVKDYHLILVANLFIIGAFDQLLRLYNLKNKIDILFNASLLVGVASIFYFPYMVYFIFIWVVLVYISTPIWRDFIVPLLGFLIPPLYVVVYYFVFKDLKQLDWKNEFIEVSGIGLIPVSVKTMLISLAVVTALSIYMLLQIISKSVVRVKKMLWVVILMSLFGLATYILNGQSFISSIISTTIPLAIIIAAFCEKLRKLWLAEIIFSLLLANLIWTYFS